MFRRGARSRISGKRAGLLRSQCEAQLRTRPAALAFGISGAVNPKGCCHAPGSLRTWKDTRWYACYEGNCGHTGCGRKRRAHLDHCGNTLWRRSQEEMGGLPDHRNRRRVGRDARRTNIARSISSVRHATRAYRVCRPMEAGSASRVRAEQPRRFALRLPWPCRSAMGCSGEFLLS